MEFMRQQQFKEKISHLAFYGSQGKFMRSLTQKFPNYEQATEDCVYDDSSVTLAMKHSPLKDKHFELDATLLKSQKWKTPKVVEHITAKFNMDKWDLKHNI